MEVPPPPGGEGGGELQNIALVVWFCCSCYPTSQDNNTQNKVISTLCSNPPYQLYFIFNHRRLSLPWFWQAELETSLYTWRTNRVMDTFPRCSALRIRWVNVLLTQSQGFSQYVGTKFHTNRRKCHWPITSYSGLLPHGQPLCRQNVNIENQQLICLQIGFYEGHLISFVTQIALMIVTIWRCCRQTKNLSTSDKKTNVNSLLPQLTSSRNIAPLSNNALWLKQIEKSAVIDFLSYLCEAWFPLGSQNP